MRIFFIFEFFASKNFVRIKTSDNQRVLCPGNMVGATEVPSLLLQFFDKSLKQHVVWRYRGAVWCPSYSTLPASFFGPLSLNYPVADNTSPNWAFRSVLKAHNVLVLECPTIHNILLFRVKFGLEMEGLGFPGSRYALFLTILLYVIHFSSPVIIRFKKGSILFRASRDVHMTTRSSKFFWLNSRGTHLEYFHTNPIFRIWSEMVCWAELSLSTISDVVRRGSCSNIALTTSSSIKDGRPERGLSERSKSPVSNFSYHLPHVLSETLYLHQTLSINFYMLP